MEQANKEKLRFCALCPDPCRNLFPAGVLPKESNMCSALAYLAHSAMEGFIAYTPEVDAQMRSTQAAQVCKAACPYGYDTAALVEEVRQELARR